MTLCVMHLAERALRVTDLRRMVAFYQDVQVGGRPRLPEVRLSEGGELDSALGLGPNRGDLPQNR